MDEGFFFTYSDSKEFLINSWFKNKVDKKNLENEIVEKELSFLMEITLRLEDELNSAILYSGKKN